MLSGPPFLGQCKKSGRSRFFFSSGLKESPVLFHPPLRDCALLFWLVARPPILYDCSLPGRAVSHSLPLSLLFCLNPLLAQLCEEVVFPQLPPLKKSSCPLGVDFSFFFLYASLVHTFIGEA